MEDKNDLSTQRRNLMLMNVLMFLLAITDKDITEFKILNIEFSLNKELVFIKNFNDLLILVWIYFLIRYTSSIAYDMINNQNFDNNSKDFFNFKTSRIFVNLTNKIIKNLVLLIFSKENLDIFPIYLSYLILINFYSSPFTYFSPMVLLIIVLVQYYNVKIIKKEYTKVLEDELKEAKRIYNIKVKKQRQIYIQKKEKLLNRKIKK